MSSRTSAARPPEFFVDRSLGKVTADRLRDQLGWTIHRLADVYPNDAQDVDDATWISKGCDRGWVLLTKDQKIRFREHELAALASDAFLFCVSRGNLTLAAQTTWIIEAGSRIERAIREGRPGFWSIYAGGRVEHRWPQD